MIKEHLLKTLVEMYGGVEQLVEDLEQLVEVLDTEDKRKKYADKAAKDMVNKINNSYRKFNRAVNLGNQPYADNRKEAEELIADSEKDDDKALARLRGLYKVAKKRNAKNIDKSVARSISKAHGHSTADFGDDAISDTYNYLFNRNKY